MDRGLGPGFKQATGVRARPVVGTRASSLHAVRIMALSRILLSRRTARYSGFRFRDNRAGIKVHAALALPSSPNPDVRPSS